MTKIPTPKVSCCKNKLRVILKSRNVEQSINLFVNGLGFERISTTSNGVFRGEIYIEFIVGVPQKSQFVFFADSETKRSLLIAEMRSVGWKPIADFICESPSDSVQIKIEILTK